MKYSWHNTESQEILEDGYLIKGETVQDAVKRISKSSANYLKRPDLASQFEDIIAKGWVSLSSPIWRNAGTKRGLPISCNGSYIGDSIESISTKLSEIIMQTKLGAGTSGYFGDIRGRGESISGGIISAGSVSFMPLFDTAMSVVSQGTRRGGFAAYLPIEHKDIKEFLKIRSVGNPLQKILTGVCVSDQWLTEMKNGDKEKQWIWLEVIKSRKEQGIPYIFYTDTVNNNKPQVYKDINRKIYSSNLCSEICLPANDDESFVCCLASLNLEYYNDWKNTNTIELLTYFLDGIMSEYIDKTKDIPLMVYSHNFAKRHRALGIGVLGMFSYFQKHLIDPESIEAKQHTTTIFKDIKKKTLKASKQLAIEYGEPELLKGYELRNTTLTAIAPTTTSSAILGGVSAGIEPYKSNYYKAKLANATSIRKNKYLKKILEDKGYDTDAIWDNIKRHKGSVQQLNILTEHERNVFKTFEELSQLALIQLAAVRQKYIDQSQSLNLLINNSTSVKDINKLMLEAHRLGIKSLYYVRGVNPSKEFVNNILNCKSCES